MKLRIFEKKILILVIGILLILSLNFFSKEVKGFFYSVSLPIQKSFWVMGNKTSCFFGAIFEAENLKKENQELRLKLQELLAENVSLKDIKNENQTLRESLQIGLPKDFELILAQVIGKDVSQDTLLLDKGSRDGVSPDMPVITQQKVLLGRISEVYEKFSRVSLISNKNSSFDAEIPDMNISGVVRGQGSSKLALEFILQDKEVKEGDLVVSSSLGGIYPSGLLVGLVKDVEKSDVESFQRTGISPFFNIGELEKIFIIINY